MKIKLYKGPLNGKSFHGPDENIIRMSYMKKLPDFNAYRSDSLAPLDIRTLTYRKVWLVDSNGHRFPSMHPDGSTFFEYVP